MAREDIISIFLGYSSIACWLCAQFPQILVNWRRKSVDGLALPFLVNWLFGDTTNLIGCLLTDQLPFQTYVAVYFVIVDFCLVIQYFHYDAPKDVKALSTLRSQSRTSLIRSPSVSYSPQIYTLPRTSLSRSRSRSYSMDPHLQAAVANASLATAELEARHAEPRTSEVDLRDPHMRWRSSGTWNMGSLEGLSESAPADPRDQGQELRVSDAGDDVLELESDSAPSLMIDSFHSEGRGRGRRGEKRVSWGASGGGGDKSHSNDTSRLDLSSTAPSTVRGRPLTRPSTDGPTSPPPRRRLDSSASIVSAAASRRSAGIVFLGVVALFGLGSRAGYELRRAVTVQGEVLTAAPASRPVFFEGQPSGSSFTPVSVTFLSTQQPHVTSDGQTKLFIGRISAWTCTTLYITSRLPQIWKNFARKSVEGLSMYLFTFAFLGNFFYVLSILTSPKMDLPAAQARQFLRSSIPYLLGSGGTLIFDVTIVIQSFIYGNQAPLNTRRRRRSFVSVNIEEGRALMGADAEIQGTI